MSEIVYVARDAAGAITQVSEEPGEGLEPVEMTDPEIRELLATSDLELVRVLEDVVELLLAQGVFRFTDLPEVAQQKLLKRRRARCMLGESGSLLVEDEIL